MKKITLLLSLVFGFAFTAYSQNFNYQAAIRDNGGNLINNQNIGVQIKLLQGSATGSTIYTETHVTTSNEQGIISLAIGTGTTTDNFSTINWSTQDYWLETAIDVSGGTTYVAIGTSKFQHVPYSKFANASKELHDADNDTKVMVERFSDEDRIRFDIAGTEKWIMGNDRFIYKTNTGSLFLGENTGGYPTQGIRNTFVGDSTAQNVLGRYNTIIGARALSGTTSDTIHFNTAIGVGALERTAGTRSVAIGVNAGKLAATRGVFIGNEAGASETQGNKLYLDNIGTVTPLIYGEFNTNTLRVGGKLQVGSSDNTTPGAIYSFPTSDGTANQVMTTDGSGNVAWTNVATKVFSTAANVTSNAPGNIASDSFVFGSSQINDDTNTSDDDYRMFFEKNFAAFRAGNSNSTSWNTSNMGFASVAFGSNTTASGSNSFASGSGTIASGNSAVAMGVNSTANAPFSIAVGLNTSASGNAAFSIGDGTTATGFNSYSQGVATSAESYTQVSLGGYNTSQSGNIASFIASDRLFVLGNGINAANKSDALVILKNGNTTLNGELTIDGDNSGSGTPYTLPAQDGVTNQVMGTDGAGNISWVNNFDTLEAVSSPTFATNWENYSALPGGNAFEDAQYFIHDGMVHLAGMIHKTTGITNGEVMITLPVTYRPLKQRIFTASSEGGIIRVDVRANGQVVFGGAAHSGGQNWVSLDGLSFRID